MLQADRDKLRERYKEFHDKGNFSLNGIARSIGLSTGTISTWLSGKYKGNYDNIDTKMKSYLDREEERKDANRHEITFCDIKNAERVWDTARIAHLNRQICVVYSEAGLGKTRSCTEYARKNSDVIFIETDPGFSARVLFRKINRELGLPGIGHISDLFDNCIDKLKDTGRLLIIDEAEALPYRALELLRRLHDKAHIGILLLGKPMLYHNLRGLNGEYTQLYSRVRIAVKLEPLRENDTRMIFDSYFPGNRDLYKSFHKAANGNGRRLEMLLLNSDDLSKLNKCKVDEEILELASKRLMK